MNRAASMRLMRALRPGLAVMLCLIGAALLLRWSGLEELIGREWVDRAVRGRGLSGEMLFLAAGTAGMAIGLPRQIVAFLAGYAFGLLLGTLLASAATVLACIGSYAVTGLGLRLVGWRPGDGRLIAFLRDNAFRAALVVRLLPVGNNLATCVAAGGARVPAVGFFAGSALGYLPQTVVFALLGSGMQLEPIWRIGGGLALFVVSTAIGGGLLQRYRHAPTPAGGSPGRR